MSPIAPDNDPAGVGGLVRLGRSDLGLATGVFGSLGRGAESEWGGRAESVGGGYLHLNLCKVQRLQA